MQNSKVDLKVNSNLKMQNDNSKFKMEFNKRLVQFSLDVIKVCREAQKDNGLWVIIDQLIRSATSIGANVIEAKSSSSRLDYLKYFQIALKSANETNTGLFYFVKALQILKIKLKRYLKKQTKLQTS
jgi:four helix bundle protein